MADLKQIRVGDTTYNIEPYSSYYRDGCSSFEMNSGGSLFGYGGFIDFHFFNSSGKPLNTEGTVVSTTPDYTSRIIEDSAGRIAINGNTYITWSGLTSSSITSNGSIFEGGTALSSKYGALETVTTNTSNITTLQGYFTGGVANEAKKVSKSLTFKGDGSGVSAGATYDGSTATTISYQSVGALSYTAASTTSKTYFIGKQTVASTCSTYYNPNFYSTGAAVHFTGASVFAGSFYATSDKRLKENIKDADTDYYDFISNIRLVKYNWKDDEDKIVQHGVIAQELKETAPEDLKDHLVSGVETDTDYLAVNDGKMVYIALGALQQQLKINQQLESRITRLEKLLGV